LVVLAILVCAQPASAQYLTRYTTLTNGAVTFTGNSLGLDGAPGQNGQGTRGGIATFITTDTTLRDATPAPSSAPLFPFGTTSDWQQNRSTAVLRVPAGARVLRAELIWGGSFADESLEGNVAAFRNNAVSFTTPAGTFSVSPDPATARNFGALEGNRCAGVRECYYVRTADVTALVAAAGPGTYATGGVPATQSAGDSNRPSAGWTLAVVYEDFAEPIRNLSLFLGFEKGTQGPAQSAHELLREPDPRHHRQSRFRRYIRHAQSHAWHAGWTRSVRHRQRSNGDERESQTLPPWRMGSRYSIDVG
jgi:hypothetical protein